MPKATRKFAVTDPSDVVELGLLDNGAHKSASLLLTHRFVPGNEVFDGDTLAKCIG
jgi:hypothetical protein